MQTATVADGDAAHEAVVKLLARLEPECRTCDDLACLDCTTKAAHDRCTRPCLDCSPRADIDWEQAWEMTALLTQLRGLDRLDRAIAGL